MFVSTRYSTFLGLLLLMATLQLYHLLPTEQSSLVPSFRHQAGSNLAIINTTSNHTLDSLGMSDLAEQCLHIVTNEDDPSKEGKRCRAYQQPWLNLILEKGVHLVDPEYKCKDDYLNAYCNVLVARAYCKDNYFDAFHEAVEQQLKDASQKCNQWTSWQPPMESIMMVTKETVECQDTLEANGIEAACTKEVAQTIANIKDPTELACKKENEVDKCSIKHANEQCSPKQAEAFRDYVGKIWSPKLVECKQWASEDSSEDPKNQKGGSKALMIVGIIIGVIVLIAILVAVCVVIYCLCFTSSGKSRGRSSPKGGSRRSKFKGSRSARSKRASSRASGFGGGSKKQSRSRFGGSRLATSAAAGSRKQSSRVRSQAKPQSRAKQSKRSRF